MFYALSWPGREVSFHIDMDDLFNLIPVGVEMIGLRVRVIPNTVDELVQAILFRDEDHPELTALGVEDITDEEIQWALTAINNREARTLVDEDDEKTAA